MSSNKVVIGDSESGVELTVLERDPRRGDVRVRARMYLERFHGEVEAWIEDEAWSRFLDELRALEGARHGSAELESMSPGELRLRIRSRDKSGHMGIEGEITHYFYESEARQRQVVGLRFGAIAFEPTILPRVLRALESATTDSHREDTDRGSPT